MVIHTETQAPVEESNRNTTVQMISMAKQWRRKVPMDGGKQPEMDRL